MANKELKVGIAAPEFSLKNQGEKEIRLSDFRGKWVVLYFYPKDNTPGCTIEALDFTKLSKEFEKLNATVLGVSPDSCHSHVKFINAKKLTVVLLSDPEHKMIETYGVWQLKEFMGKKFMGVVRSTFLIDPEGKIAFLWSPVTAVGHADAVKTKLKELQKQTTSV